MTPSPHLSSLTSIRLQFCASLFACLFFPRILPFLHLSKFMVSSCTLYWFDHTISVLSDTDKALLRPTYGIPCDHGILFPNASHCPHQPPLDYTTFILDQLRSGLCFLVSPFLEDIATYPRIPISQFTPNVFRLLCSIAIVFKYFKIPLTLMHFHYFFFTKRLDNGLFYFGTRSPFKFLGPCPIPPRTWKIQYFFIHSPTSLSCPVEWVIDLPIQPTLESFKEKLEYQEIIHLLDKYMFDTNLLISEDILYYFELSPK